MNLYEIANEYELALSGSFDDETGEVSEGALMELERLTGDIKEKGIAIASYIGNLEAEANAIDSAINSMKKRQIALEKKQAALREYLKSNMERCEITEISSPYFTMKLKKCPISVDIINQLSIPIQYRSAKITEIIDKIAIKTDLAKGIEVAGAMLKQNTRLEIK